MQMGLILAAAAFVVILVWFFSRRSVGVSRLEVSVGGESFPIVSGTNLDRVELEFPTDLSGEINLLIVPFEQRQQLDVNTWIPAVQALEQTYRGFVYYELPTIYQLPSISRTFINEGMRAGIPDQTSRERTVTLYIDKESFKQALGIESENVIHLFLVDRMGVILWRGTGVFSEEVLSELEKVIQLQLRG